MSSDKNQRKRLLVTGGAGFIGSSFVDQAVQRGYEVWVLDALTYAGHRENLEWISGPGSWRLIEGNICNASFVKELFQASLADGNPFRGVLNFAAESHVDRSISNPMEFVDTNVKGTLILLQESAQYFKGLNGMDKDRFRYLQVSTDEVFGSLGATGKFSEKTPYSPNSPYSASKAAADHLVMAWSHTYHLPTLITHCSNNYGPRQYPEKLIPLMIDSCLNERPLPVYGNGMNVRDWIHVEDHCAGIFLTYEKGHPGERYCFGGNAEKTNIEVVETICKTLDELKPRANKQSYKDLINFVQDRPGHDWRYAIDDRYAAAQLGFNRHYTFEHGLQMTVKWYLENQSWSQKVLAKNKK